MNSTAFNTRHAQEQQQQLLLLSLLLFTFTFMLRYANRVSATPLGALAQCLLRPFPIVIWCTHIATRRASRCAAVCSVVASCRPAPSHRDLSLWATPRLYVLCVEVSQGGRRPFFSTTAPLQFQLRLP